MIDDPPQLGPGDGEGAVTRLFHRTTITVAEAIIANGFEDRSCLPFSSHMDQRGVFFSLWAPYDENQGAHGGAVLSIDLPTAVVMPYIAWEYEEGLGVWELYEAFVPAYVVNRHGPLTVVDWDVSWEALGPFTPIEWNPALKAFRPPPE